jgi:seryl-tRNA synthetase
LRCLLFLAKYAVECGKNNLNTIQKQISQKAKAKEDFTDLKQQKELAEKELPKLQKAVEQLEEELETNLNKIGNIVHDTVPISQDEVSVS